VTADFDQFVMKPVADSRAPGRHSLDRRDFLQLATMFGLSLTVPSFAAKAAAAPLAADELILIGEVSELIIPTTDTGGALAAGVPEFVKTMLSDWFSAAERENFLSGMREFSTGASRKYGKKFSELNASQKDQYFGEQLAKAEAALAPTSSASAPRTPFVVLMKRLTIFGYYTSELGATVELHQQIAAAQYVPAAVVKPGDRADSGILSAMYPFNAS
jgi:Gluconate 2-dehydrogenase subunit 3